MNKFFAKIDDSFGPDKKQHKEACYEDKEMLLDCVLNS